MSRKSLVAAIAGAGVVALLLAGCGRGADSPSTQGAGAAIDGKPAKGTISVWAMGVEGELLTKLTSDFEKANPDATVKVTAVPWQDAAKKIETAVASGSTPDATMVGSSDLASFVSAGGLEPVPKGLVDPASFFPGAQSSTEIEGASYAVPWYVETRVLFYRKDLAAAAGATVPKTWDEFTSFAKALQSAGAKWGFSTSTGAPFTWQAVLPYLWQAGAKLTDSNLSTFSFDTPEAKKGLEYYKSLFTDGVASQSGPVNLGEVEPKFVSGEVGSFLSGPWEPGLLKQAGGSEFMSKVGMAVVPAGPKAGTSYIGGSHFAVFTDAKNRDGAWKLIRWLSSSEAQQKWFQIAGDLPAVEAAWHSGAIADNPDLTVFGEQLKDAQNAPAVTTWPQIGSLVDSESEKVAKGTATPEAALKELEAAANKVGTGK